MKKEKRRILPRTSRTIRTCCKISNSKFVGLVWFVVVFLFSCTSTPKITELENKGTVMGISAPEWVKTYLDKGVSALQAQYPDKYCIVGEESGVNRQFVLAWADQMSAQQRIGALLRTNIASRYQAVITSDATVYEQEMNNILNAVVNVSYSGAQREADWWVLNRRYDPDQKDVYTDTYTAYVLYTIPKTELNRQIALALETSVKADSALYDVTIALARDILLQGYDEKAIQTTVSIQQTAVASYAPQNSITAQAIGEITFQDEYYIGRAVAATLLSTYKLLDAPELTDYLNRICQAIVINSPIPSAYNGYFAAVLDSDTVNAFATPGGHIFLTRGLINTAKSEDALAAIIAHEIAHIQLKHGVISVQTTRDLDTWFNLLTTTGPTSITSRLNAGYSRIQEFDADITALSLLADAGYNTTGLLDMLKEMEKAQSGIRGGFNDTHPSPASRLTNAKVAALRYANMPDNSRTRQRRFDQIF